jgi:hypothetical protein
MAKMIEKFGNLWDEKAIVLTTNGAVRRDGACVMGRGIAAEAKRRFPELPFALGEEIKKFGNIPFALGIWGQYRIWTLPVKHHWAEPADLSLIRESMERLLDLVKWTEELHIPRPGCGNGNRSWSEVRPIIAEEAAKNALLKVLYVHTFKGDKS